MHRELRTEFFETNIRVIYSRNVNIFPTVVTSFLTGWHMPFVSHYGQTSFKILVYQFFLLLT